MAESAKNQLLRDFRRRSIFDFCNTIPSKADLDETSGHIGFVPTADSCTQQIASLFDHLELRTGGPLNIRHRPTERLVVARKCQIDNGLSTNDI